MCAPHPPARRPSVRADGALARLVVRPHLWVEPSRVLRRIRHSAVVRQPQVGDQLHARLAAAWGTARVRLCAGWRSISRTPACLHACLRACSHRTCPPAAPRRIAAGKYTAGGVMNVLMSAVTAGHGLGQAVHALPAFQAGRAAAARIFAVVDAEPGVSLDASGDEPAEVGGSLELVDVTFAYPARPDRVVLRDFSLAIPAGARCGALRPPQRRQQRPQLNDTLRRGAIDTCPAAPPPHPPPSRRQDGGAGGRQRQRQVHRAPAHPAAVRPRRGGGAAGWARCAGAAAALAAPPAGGGTARAHALRLLDPGEHHVGVPRGQRGAGGGGCHLSQRARLHRQAAARVGRGGRRSAAQACCMDDLPGAAAAREWPSLPARAPPPPPSTHLAGTTRWWARRAAS